MFLYASGVRKKIHHKRYFLKILFLVTVILLFCFPVWLSRDIFLFKKEVVLFTTLSPDFSKAVHDIPKSILNEKSKRGKDFTFQFSAATSAPVMFATTTIIPMVSIPIIPNATISVATSSMGGKGIAIVSPGFGGGGRVPEATMISAISTVAQASNMFVSSSSDSFVGTGISIGGGGYFEDEVCPKF